MKIAYIALRGVPLSDGIVQYTDALARELVKRGHEITVYTSRRYGNKTGVYQGGYAIKTIPSLPWGFAEKMSLVFFASCHQLFQRFDVVHYHAMGPSIFAFMARMTGKATVIQSHGIEYNRAKFGVFAKGTLRVLEKWSVNMSDAIIVICKALQEHFMKAYGKDTVLIYNAVELPPDAQCSQGILDKWRLSENGYYLYLARITQEKGLHYLIHAFQRLDTDKKLVIAGPFDSTNPYHARLQKMAEADKRIIFIGPAYGDEKDSLLCGAYCFCLPSESEGFSVALLEAMSYGKCCVVSDIPGNLEAIGACGFQFASKDEDSLYQVLEKAEGDAVNVQEIGCKARQRIRTQFHIDTLVENTEQLYMRLLDGKKQKRRRKQ